MPGTAGLAMLAAKSLLLGVVALATLVPSSTSAIEAMLRRPIGIVLREQGVTFVRELAVACRIHVIGRMTSAQIPASAAFFGTAVAFDCASKLLCSPMAECAYSIRDREHHEQDKTNAIHPHKCLWSTCIQKQ